MEATEHEAPRLAELSHGMSPVYKQLVLLLARGERAFGPDAKIHCTYVCRAQGKAGNGVVHMRAFLTRLLDAGVLESDEQSVVRLTAWGHRLAGWLERQGERADFFHSEWGEWGTTSVDPLGLAQVLTGGAPDLSRVSSSA